MLGNAADKVKLTDLPTSTLESGSPLSLGFDTSEAGLGKLQATCEGDKVGDVPCEVKAKEGDKDKYSVSFIPPEEDVYHLSTKWCGKHVPGSPFKLNLKQPMADKVELVEPPSGTVASGAPLSMVFSTKEAGGGQLTASCKGENSGDIPCSVKSQPDDKFEVSFVPPQLDVYHVDVLWSGQHVPGSPYKINLLPADAEKVEMVAEPENLLEAGVPMDLDFNTSGAGGGNLEATCVGSKVGEVPVAVKQKEEDKYNVSFTPPEPDVYELSIKWGGDHVKGSPFKLNMLENVADKVKVIELPASTLETGSPLNIGFDTSEAGLGKLQTTCEGDKVGEVPCQVQRKSDDKDKYTVSFVPPQNDIYHVNVKWQGKAVPGSPFKINMLPPVAENVVLLEKPSANVEAGSPLNLSFDTNDAGSGQLDATCLGDKSGELPCTVNRTSENKYEVSFVPPIPDVYFVHVKWSGNHVPGSPFKFNLHPPVADNVAVAIPDHQLESGVPMDLDFDALDAGGGELEAVCVGSKVGDVPISVELKEDDKYKVTFTPPEPDIYEVSIKWSGKHVKGSPFKINTLNAADNVKLVETPSSKVDYGAPLSLGFDTSKAGLGRLHATCEGDKVGDVPCEVKAKEDNKDVNSVSFIPPEEDVYHLSVKWCGKHVPGSPFKLNLKQPMADKVELVEPPSGSIASGAPLSMVFSTKEAGGGQLTASCNGEKSGEVPCSVKSQPDNKYAVSFLPPQLDIYHVDVLWAGEHVPGSPYKINLLPSNAEEVEMVAEPQDVLESGMPMELDFNTSSAGGGNLEANCVGTKVGEVPVTVKQKEENTYGVSFTPPEPDLYELSVMWSGKHVKGSPFKVNLLENAAGCVKVVELPPASVESDTPVCLNLDTSEAGLGKLEVSCKGEKVGEVSCEVQPKSDEKNKYTISFVPPQEDVYHVNVKWQGKDVPGSPFIINMLPPVAENVVLMEKPSNNLESGAPLDLTFDTNNAGYGKLEATCFGEKLGDLPCTVQATGENKYKVSFVPPSPDVYFVHVKWSGHHVPGSPFKFNLHPPVADNVAVMVTDNPLKAGVPMDLDFDAMNAGGGELEAVCIGSKIGEVPITVEIKEDYKYKVTFTPPEPDNYEVSIKWSGKHVRGSPFKMNMLNAADTIKLVETPSSKLESGSPLCLGFDTSKAGVGTLEASCVGDKAGDIVCEVKEREGVDGRIIVSFIPPEEDVYHLQVKWSGKHVKGSPFKLSLIPPMADKVVLIEKPSSVIQFGSPLRLGFDTKEAGGGQLLASCRGDRVGDVTCTVRRKANSIYYVSFVPLEPDLYHVTVTWAGEHVPGSPFRINLLSPIAENVKISTSTDSDFRAQAPVDLRVDTSGAGGGHLDATCVGNKVGETPVDINSAGEEDYCITFTPPEADTYLVHVKWSGVEISESPVQIKVLPVNANLVKLLESPPSDLTLGDQCEYEFDTSKAGGAKLICSCKGDTVGDIAVTVNDVDTNQYRVSVNPTEHDVYRLDVLFGGQHVPGSPFVVDLSPVDIDKVVAICPVEAFSVDAPVSIMLQTRDAGKGKVTAEAEGVHCGVVPVSVKETSADVYEVTFTPKHPDLYHLSVLYGNQHIKGSPFRINTLPPDSSKIQVSQPDSVQLQSPVLTSLNTLNAGNGKLSATCSGKRSGNIPTDITKTEEGIYDVTFIPKKPDIYTLCIKWSGNDVPGSPFTFNLLPFNSENCKCSAPDDVSLSNPVEAALDCLEAGDAVLTADCHTEDSDVVQVDVVEKSPFVYGISFTPRKPTIYTLNALYGGSPIPSFPLIYNLKPANPQAVVCENLTVSPDDVPVVMDIDANLGGNGKLTCTVTGKSVGVISAKVLAKENNKFTISFHPDQPDIYTLSVLWNGQPIADSPFIINLLPPCPEMVKPTITWVPYEQSAPIECAFDTSDAGRGVLYADCSSKDGKAVPVDVVYSVPEQEYTASFTAPEPNIYYLNVKWNDVPVVNSPFKFNLFPSDLKSHETVKRVDAQISDKDILAYFDTSDAGRGKLTATCKEAVSPVDVRERTPGTYEAEIPIHKQQPYVLHTYWNDRRYLSLLILYRLSQCLRLLILLKLLMSNPLILKMIFFSSWKVYFLGIVSRMFLT